MNDDLNAPPIMPDPRSVPADGTDATDTASSAGMSMPPADPTLGQPLPDSSAATTGAASSVPGASGPLTTESLGSTSADGMGAAPAGMSPDASPASDSASAFTSDNTTQFNSPDTAATGDMAGGMPSSTSPLDPSAPSTTTGDTMSGGSPATDEPQGTSPSEDSVTPPQEGSAA